MKKKGQGGEMLGLLVIIILLLVLGTIFFKFASKPDSKIIAESTSSVTSSNLLRAMMQYTLCSGKDFEDAVKECVKTGGPICGQPSSCDLIAREANATLAHTLKGELERESLVFIIEDATQEEVVRIPKEADLKCRSIIFAPAQRVNLFPGSAKVKLGRCVS